MVTLSASGFHSDHPSLALHTPLVSWATGGGMQPSEPTTTQEGRPCPGPPLHIYSPYQEKEQGRPPTDTATSLPAFRWLPSMPIQVPPERGPLAGLTR